MEKHVGARGGGMNRVAWHDWRRGGQRDAFATSNQEETTGVRTRGRWEMDRGGSGGAQLVSNVGGAEKAPGDVRGYCNVRMETCYFILQGLKESMDNGQTNRKLTFRAFLKTLDTDMSWFK